MHVPFYSLSDIHANIKNRILEDMGMVIDKGDFILGTAVSDFEKAYADYTKAGHCIAVSNGLDALKICLRTLGIGAGDEVIVPAHTFIATIFAVLETGAKPILIDADIHTCNISTAAIEVAITSRTKAIITVHMYGQPCDMKAIGDIASRHSLYVIEDNAQAQGATFMDHKTGSFGHINATSFYPSKNLGAMGDAGAITTGDASLAQKARMLRNVGSDVKYHHDVVGYNARMDTLQAIILKHKLPELDTWNAERRRLAERYMTRLSSYNSIILPQIINKAVHAFHLFVIRHNDRDKLQQYLLEKDIHTQIHYPIPPHFQPALKHLGYGAGSFPVAEGICNTCLSLPLFIGMTDKQVDFVSKNIIAFIKP